jgi:hypothetical protein
MSLLKPKYKFYATLLDSYRWYLKSESDDCLQELINKINRVPFVSEAAEKGTAFNALIDSVLIGYDKFGEQITRFDSFEFNTNLVKEIAESLTGAVPQYRTSGLIMTSKGLVEIYGNIDYIIRDKSIDLKCTGSYDLGKFKDSMQRHVYPVCLSQEGIIVDEFEFLVTDYRGIFRENYRVNLEESEREIISVCESFIDFLEIKKSEITDKKVFAQDVMIAELDSEVNAIIVQ